MPEPPAGPSPATVQRIQGVQARARTKAAAHSALPGGAAQVGAAQKAVTEPDAEAVAKAQAALLAQVKAAPSPEIVKLGERIREVIRKKRPPDEDALMVAEPEAEAVNAGKELNATVDSETKKVQGNYGPVNDAPPATAPAKGENLPPQPATAATAPLDAQAATPDAVPAGKVSLDQDAAESSKRAQDAGMHTAPADLVKSGPVAEARNAQGELDQAAKEDPAKVLEGQKRALGKAEGDMAALQARALAALEASRESTAKGNATRQGGMVTSEESKRVTAAAEAKKVFEDAKSMVTAQLKDLPATAMEEWDKAKEVLAAQFKADLKIVQTRVEKRHAGVGGWFVGVWDVVTGLPGWAEELYSKAESAFAEGVISKLLAISAKVNSVIAACDLIITDARGRIAKIYDDLPESLRGFADQEKAKFDGQLDQLHNEVIATRDNFNKELVKSSSAAVDEVRAEIAELRKKAGGLVGRIVSAINRFVEDPVKFIIEGLLELLGIPPASFWAVVAKIKKVIKDIADDPMRFANNLLKGLAEGFGLFFSNFATHLLKGFLEWLLGGVKDVQIPKEVSVKSVVTFFLQLMGITWPNIRKILVKLIGAKNVALVEKVYSLVSLLIEKGPEGIYEMIKEKLDPQAIVDQVVQMAVDFMVSAIIKQVSARIIALFNPAGAIIQALEAIYRVLKWIFQNAAKIFTLVETVVNGIADILAGNTAGFAAAVEKGLAMLIAPVISFIADYLSLGDLPQIVAEKVKSMREWILGLIEKALTWLIEKGKALLAALGIGKKGEKKAGEAEQVGESIDFEADGEPHQLWIDVAGERATLMVASDQQTVKQYLAYVQRHGSAGVAAKAKLAQQLADQTDVEADDLAKLAAHVSEEKESSGRQKLSARQDALKGKEKQLVEALMAIFEEMSPITPRIGKPVDDIKRTPVGYELWNDVGTYEYGESYEYREIQRASGFGGADEKSFPRVHVDSDAAVQRDAGILRSDREVINIYRAAIAPFKPFKGDEAPNFKDGSDAPANQLANGANKDRAFNRGIRKQMEAIIKALRDRVEITGVEVVVGKRRVDYTSRMMVGRSEQHVMVEYKHWTGKLSPDRRELLATKLESQLKGQILGGAKRFPVLLIDWPAFGELDSKSQDRFSGVIFAVTSFGFERNVRVEFRP